MEEERFLFWFHSTNAALKTERLLRNALIPCAVIPTPADLTSECGISLLLDARLLGRARAVLDRAGCTDYELAFPDDGKWTTDKGR